MLEYNESETELLAKVNVDYRLQHYSITDKDITQSLDGLKF